MKLHFQLTYATFLVQSLALAANNPVRDSVHPKAAIVGRQDAVTANGPSFQATAWETCQDLPSFQCRNVTVPRFYEAVNITISGSEGTLVNLERRLISGKPKKHVWLLQGGPAVTTDSLSRIGAPQFAAALGTDYIIQIPSQRGSPHTQTIPDYPDDPQNLAQYLGNQSIPIQAFTTTNIARDIITSVKIEKANDPSVEHLAYGLSYGTYLLNRVLQIEPDLFKRAVSDGNLPPSGIGRSGSRLQGLGSIVLAETLSEYCAGSESCRSLSLDALIQFVDNLTRNISTPCFDTFAKALGNQPANDQTFDDVARQLSFLHNMPMLVALFNNQTLNLLALTSQIDDWYRGNRSQPQFINWDTRVFLWALTNHFAQCNATTESAFDRLLQRVFLPALNVSSALQSSDTVVSMSSIASRIVGQEILVSETDDPPWTADLQRNLQNHTLIRSSDLALKGADDVRTAYAPFHSAPDQYTGQTATNVEADLIFVNGDLDPNTPYFGAREYFQAIQVAPGYTKKFYTVPKAGHVIVLGAWSPLCTPILLKAYIADDDAAKTRYPLCLAEEEQQRNGILDWKASDLLSAMGIDLWEGLVKAD